MLPHTSSRTLVNPRKCSYECLNCFSGLKSYIKSHHRPPADTELDHPLQILMQQPCTLHCWCPSIAGSCSKVMSCAKHRPSMMHHHKACSDLSLIVEYPPHPVRLVLYHDSSHLINWFLAKCPYITAAISNSFPNCGAIHKDKLRYR